MTLDTVTFTTVTLHNLETDTQLVLPSPLLSLVLEDQVRWDEPESELHAGQVRVGPLLRARLSMVLEVEETTPATHIRERWLEPLKQLLRARRAWGPAALKYPPRVTLRCGAAHYLVRLERLREHHRPQASPRRAELTLDLKLRELLRPPAVHGALAAQLGPPSRGWWDD